MSKRGIAFALVVLTTATAVICVSAGYWLGRNSAAVWLTKFHEEREAGQSLAGALAIRTDIDMDDIAPAYFDPESASRNAENIVSWAPTELHPHLGSVPRPGTFLNCRVNSMSMRSAREVRIPKPEKTIRAFITGGSTAFCFAAPDDESTIDRFAEKMLGEKLADKGWQAEFFNAANSEWSTVHERIQIENELSRLQPDAVISLSGFNDLFYGSRGVSVFDARTTDFLSYLTLSDYATSLAKRTSFELPVIPQGPSPLSPEEVARNLLLNAKQSARHLREFGCAYIFALQPYLPLSRKPLSVNERQALDRSETSGIKDDYGKAVFGEIIHAFNESSEPNLHFLDLTGVFDELSEPMFLDLCHFGDRGNKVIGERLAATVLEILP